LGAEAGNSRPAREEITVDAAPGTTGIVRQQHGSLSKPTKMHEHYDPSDRLATLARLQQSTAKNEIVTGLLYVDAAAQDLHGHLATVDASLNKMNEKELCLGVKALEAVNTEYR
jgi:2-oxoglutarate/2-oxoacid ferredoxin oxidoreductase subunit beta